MALLHGIFKYAEQHGLIDSNPAKLVEKPKIRPSQDIKYLTLAELEKLIREVPNDALGQVERPLYEAAARAGMRLGELLGVRWRYIDFAAQKIRVRETFVRKQFDTPKSMRGSRAIPLDPKLARTLKEHRLLSHWSRDDDLVFAQVICLCAMGPTALAQVSLADTAELWMAKCRPQRGSAFI